MTKIGRGLFSWDGIERQTDRYGTFALCDHDEDAAFDSTGKKHVFSDFTADDNQATVDVEALAAFGGKYVRITAKVIETRKSRHLGDKGRGIKPTTPNVGEVIDLDCGEFFIEKSRWPNGSACGDVFIGMMPLDGRDSPWMDPHKLYRLHNQTVEIYIEEVERPRIEVKPVPIDMEDITIGMLSNGDGTFQIKRFR